MTDNICVICGKSVKFGSGRYINRICVFDSYKEKVKLNYSFPKGKYICESCDTPLKNYICTLEMSGFNKDDIVEQLKNLDCYNSVKIIKKGD